MGREKRAVAIGLDLLALVARSLPVPKTNEEFEPLEL